MESKVYVANTGNDSISIICLKDWKEIDRIFLNPIHNKHDIDRIFTGNPSVGPCRFCFDRLNGYLYCVNSYDDSMSQIDIVNNKIISTLFVGVHPSDICTYPESNFIYVCCNDSNTVSIIKKQVPMKLTESIPVGSYPHRLNMSPDGKLLIVTNIESKEVMIINCITMNVIKTIKFYGNISKAIMNQDTEIYVIATDKDYNELGAIQKINIHNGVRAFSIPVGSMPTDIKLLQDGNKALVSNTGSKDISLVDILQNKVIYKFLVGNMPNDICLSKTEGIAFVSNSIDSTVSVINIKELTTDHIIKVGKEPTGIIII